MDVSRIPALISKGACDVAVSGKTMLLTFKQFDGATGEPLEPTQTTLTRDQLMKEQEIAKARCDAIAELLAKFPA